MHRPKVVIGFCSRGTELYNKRAEPTEVRVEGINEKYVLPIWLEHMARVVREAKKIADIEVVHIVDEHNVRLIDAQRNLVFAECLKRNPDYVWAIDDDTFPPINALDMLLTVNKPIVSGIYWGKSPESVPIVNGIWCMEKPEMVYQLEPDRFMNGLGCVLFKTEVLRKLTPPFVPLISTWKNKWGDDYMFFEHVFNQTGETCWLHKGVLCDHYDWHYDKWYPDESECIKWGGRKKFATLGLHINPALYGVHDRQNRRQYDIIQELIEEHICKGDKTKPFTFVELGVLNGNMERHIYSNFPNAKIYGMVG